MLFHVFATLSCPLKPIILIPGAMRSPLIVNSTRRYSWYCPKKISSDQAWLNPLSFRVPFLNCYMDYMSLDWSDERGQPTDRENCSLETLDVGNISAVESTGVKVFGYAWLHYFDKIVNRLASLGYKRHVNMFGAAYDWRYGAAHLGEYYDKLKVLVESAYVKNNNTKVHLFSHSLGGWVIYIFLTDKTTPEWRAKYIDGCTMSAPSWSGSGMAFQCLWRRVLPWVPFLRLNTIKEFIESCGMFYIHMPNAFYYQNDTILITPNGTKYNGTSYHKAVKEMLPEKAWMIGKKNIDYTLKPHKELDVPTNIAYNSGIKLITGIDMSVMKLIGKSIIMDGDGLVGSKGLDWVCKNWNKTDLKCVDFNKSSSSYVHRNLPRTKEAIDVYMEMIFGKNVTTKKQMHQMEEEL